MPWGRDGGRQRSALAQEDSGQDVRALPPAGMLLMQYGTGEGTMAPFVKVAKLQDIPEDGKVTLEIDDRMVVVFRVGGELFCLDDVCTHDGGPLGDGRLEGHLVACPRHGAQFDIRTGCPRTMPATEPTATHEVKLDGDEVWVRLSED